MEDSAFDDFLKESLSRNTVNDKTLFKQRVLNQLPANDTDFSWMKTIVITTFTVVGCLISFLMVPEIGNVGFFTVKIIHSLLTLQVLPLYMYAIVATFILSIVSFISIEKNNF